MKYEFVCQAEKFAQIQIQKNEVFLTKRI